MKRIRPTATIKTITTTTTTGRDVYEYARGGGTTQPRKLTDFGLPASVEKVDTVMTVDNYKSVSKMYLFVGDSYYT